MNLIIYWHISIKIIQIIFRMAASPTDNQVQHLVREKLNAEKVKLWLPPYTTEDGQKGEAPEVGFNLR